MDTFREFKQNPDKITYEVICALMPDLTDKYTIIKTIMRLSKFVADVCKDRKDHHGFPHMFDVMVLAVNLYYENLNDQPYDEQVIEGIIVVAICHDILDGKLHDNKDGKMENKLKTMLIINFPSNAVLYFELIQSISQSKEIKYVKETGLSWHDNLKNKYGSYGVGVVEIVSDADRIRSLGKEGFQRTKDFNSEYLDEEFEGFEEYDEEIRLFKREIKLYEKVKYIYDLKLSSLINYIYTSAGKRIGMIKQNELDTLVFNWKYELDEWGNKLEIKK